MWWLLGYILEKNGFYETSLTGVGDVYKIRFKFKGVEDDYKKDGVVAVMAVDNLPCALPRDASRHFGDVFIRQILPNLIQMGSLINRASITFDGKLTNRFNYLSDYVS